MSEYRFLKWVFDEGAWFASIRLPSGNVMEYTRRDMDECAASEPSQYASQAQIDSFRKARAVALACEAEQCAVIPDQFTERME